MNSLRATLIFVLLLITACDNDLGQTKTHGSARELTIQMGWIPDAHQLGFWVALERGYYRELSLDVTILPGGIDSSPVKAVASGAAEIGQLGGIEQLLIAADNGLNLVAIAAIHRETPHALISLEPAISKPSDLVGKKIAVAFGDAAEVLLRATLKRYDIDESQLELVPFRYDLTPLVQGQVDAVTGFQTDQPATLKAKGLNPTILAYSDFGVKSYGYTLVARNDEIEENSDDYKRFLEATRRGWVWAHENPKRAIDLLIALFPVLNREVETEKLMKIWQIMGFENETMAQWDIDPVRVAEVSRILQEFRQISRPILPTEVIAPL